MRFTYVRADINLKEVTINSVTGDYNPTSLANVINTETLNSLVARTWLDRSGASVSQVEWMHPLILAAQTTANPPWYSVSTFPTSRSSQTFRDVGIDARYVHSKTPVAEWRLLVEDFKAGKYPVLVSCGSLSLPPIASANPMSSDGSAVLTEGADIPENDCIIVARPTRSRNVMAQMVRPPLVPGLAPIDLVRRLDAG